MKKLKNEVFNYFNNRIALPGHFKSLTNLRTWIGVWTGIQLVVFLMTCNWSLLTQDLSQIDNILNLLSKIWDEHLEAEPESLIPLYRHMRKTFKKRDPTSRQENAP